MPKYGLNVVTPQVGEIFLPTDVDVLNHLRIDSSDADNSVLSLFITAAREFVEAVSARQFLPVQYLFTLDCFPGVHEDEYRPLSWRYGSIRLPKPPLISVDMVQYIDTNGVLQTLQQNNDTITQGGWQYSNKREPGVVAPQRFTVWPITDPQSYDAVQVTYTCGYANAAAVPQRAKQAIRMIMGHLYEHREDTIEQALSKVSPGALAFIAALTHAEYV